MKIREANFDDLPVILEMWEQSDLPCKPKGRDKIDNLKAQMKQHNMWILVAEENKEIIGTVLVSHDTRKGWINRLIIRSNRTREGIATKLLKEAENSLIANGIRVFAAVIVSDNLPSRALFEKENYIFYEEITYYSKRFSPES
ncbi:MAG: GNAT family N-acetyltransferase [Asgard group archaeon]|nr:GNAT family N-acetyltransferase [Asgard group archaeon]